MSTISFTKRAARYPSQRGFELKWEISHRLDWLVRIELAPFLWNGESFGYTVPEGGQGSWQKCKRRIPQSLNEKRCDWRKRVASQLRRRARELGISDTSIHQWRKEL